jgi:DNA helicase II / ATP-dependent DNA helicase PcrA
MTNNNILQEILECNEFPMSIKASAGTGKTYTMIAKIKHEIETNNMKPENILVSTFTVDAANEIKNRLPDFCDGITAGTLHSIMLNVVKNHGGKSFVVMDSLGQQKLGFEICKENKLNFDKINKYINMMAFLKNTEPDYYQMLEDETLPGMEDGAFSTFITEYFRKQSFASKRGNNIFRLDFADMLLFALDIFRNNKYVLEQYQEMWKHIFIDESQDTSPVQAAIIFLLAEKHKNLYLTGDFKQRIFGFSTGYGVDFMTQVENKYNLKIFELPITYRCPICVTEKSNLVAKIIDGSKIDTNSNIVGQLIKNVNFENWSQEAEFVGQEAMKIFKNTSESIRIIFRTNAQALNFQLLFIKNNIPFSSNYNNNIFNRKEVKAGLALCDFMFEYNNLNLVQKLDTLKLVKFFLPIHADYHNFIYEAKKKKLDPMREQLDFQRYDYFIDELEILKRKMSNFDTPSDVFNNIASLEIFKDISDNAELNLIGVSEFLRDANNMLEARELIDTISKPRTISKHEKCIILSTVHGSKGLESDNVFVTGLSDGLFPLTSGEPDEENRLFYVAITRSKKNLWLTGCDSFGKNEFVGHSFVEML